MNSRKADFPIFSNHPDLIYLDSASTTQKPKFVVDKVDEYIYNFCSNTGRGSYDIALKSEDIYYQSKQKVAKLINAKTSEIIYTHSTTYAFNLITQSLINSNIIKSGDSIMLPIAEHHANILPRQYISSKYNIAIKRIAIDKYGQIDYESFVQQYDSSVKIISLSTVSNVLGIVNFDIIKKIKKHISEDALLILDASQSLWHIYTDVQDLWADIMIRGGHKMMAYTSIGVAYISSKLLSKLQPVILGWGIVDTVDLWWYKLLTGTEVREAGSPDMIGAVSIGAVCDYIDSIWWYEYISAYDKTFSDYRYSLYNSGKINAKMLYEYNPDIVRLSLFSINISNIIWPKLLEQNICVRVGGHCAQPLHQVMNDSKPTIRISPYIYNSLEDLDKIISIINS